MSEQIDRLIVHYQKALLIKPDNAEIYINLAELYYKLGQLDKTVTACETALKIQPTLTGISKTLAGVLQQRGEVDAAFEMYNALGERLVKEGKLEEAIAAYRSAIELKPDAYQTFYRLAELLQGLQRWQEAIYCYLQVISCYQEGLDVEQIFVDSYYRLIDIKNNCPIQEAIRSYRQIIREKPDFYLPYPDLGDMLTQQGNLEEAISCYQTGSYKHLLSSHPDFAKNYLNPQNPRKPNFMIVGIGKGGTSSLYYYLGKHPQILPAIRKEIHFFSENIERGLDWYLSHFPPIPKESNFLTGEATPWYLGSYEVEKKVASVFPNIKIIILLRNPIFRAFSQYQMQLKFAGEQRAFADVINSEIEAIKNFSSPGEVDSDYWQTEKGYLFFGLYFYFIEKWMTVFPREQFLILRSEDFYANPAATITQVFEFLGVPDYSLAEYPNYNPGSYNPLSDDLQQTLAEFFRPHNQKLEEYLGMKFDWD
ncbi:tetratricopeptide repeat protein [Microcoleus sp. B4-C1]|uniref:tetratricopeptide repeat protein n=1 Tax=Microcoleus sp. B4-C1 TaxID=2818660 RepID=UPI002FD1D5C6